MNDTTIARWEANLQTAARAFAYPPTPDVAGAVRRRLSAARRPAARGARLAWAAAIVALALAGLLFVPGVRAGVVEFIRIGVVRIFLLAPTPTPPGTQPITATPRPSPTPLPSVLDLAGETTLEKAQTEAGFHIALPTYPPDLGKPDRVFLQYQGAPVVVLVWLEAGHPDRVRLSLHLLGPGSWGVGKMQPRVIQETTVNGQPAAWTEGPYILQLSNGDYTQRRLIEGHVLIWTDDKITYRLETNLTLEEAMKIAESLR